MSEREVRALLRQACKELDQRSKSTARQDVRLAVVPLVLGTGLFVAACGDETVAPEQPAYMAVGAYTAQGGAGGAEGGAGGADGGAGGAQGGAGGAQGGAGGQGGG